MKKAFVLILILIVFTFLYCDLFGERKIKNHDMEEGRYMAINLIPAPTGGAPLTTGDYNAQNAYIQSLILALNQKTLHLTEWDTLTRPRIEEGVYINHGGALFQVQGSSSVITGSPSAGRVYIKVSRSGDTLTAAFVNSASGYNWSYVYNGFYDSSGNQLLPYVLWLDGTNYYKYDLEKSTDKFDITEPIEFTIEVDTGDWSMQANAFITFAHGLGPYWKYISEISIIIRNDNDDNYNDLNGWDVQNTIASGGVSYLDSTNIQICHNFEALCFANADYNSTSYNRGTIYFRIRI